MREAPTHCDKVQVNAEDLPVALPTRWHKMGAFIVWAMSKAKMGDIAASTCTEF
jgi:hypothetical protein